MGEGGRRGWIYRIIWWDGGGEIIYLKNKNKTKQKRNKKTNGKEL